MASSKRASRPHKRDNRDYNIDDFVNPTGFEHMFSFLNVRRPPTAEPPTPILTEPIQRDTSVPCPADPDSELPPVVTANSSTPTLGTPELLKAEPQREAINSSTPEFNAAAMQRASADPSRDRDFLGGPLGPPSLGTPYLGPPVLNTPGSQQMRPPGGTHPEVTSPSTDSSESSPDFVQLRARLRPTPRPWRDVQDAHTHGEHRVYETLWRLGRPIGPGNSRELVIGIQALANAVPMKYDNCRANVQSLIQKLAIEQRPVGNNQLGRYYLVFSMSAILERRRKAGLTHVLKRTQAVQLCRTPELNNGTPNLGTPDFELDWKSGPPILSTPPLNMGVPNLGESIRTAGVPNLGVQLRNNENRNSSSAENPPQPILDTASPVIVKALREATGASDDDAAKRITADCRRNTPDITDEEIAAMIGQRAAALLKAQGITNRMGLLIRMVPRSCTGESLRQYRAEMERCRQADQERQAREETETQRLAQSILDEPNEWPAEQLDWARGILSAAGKL